MIGIRSPCATATVAVAAAPAAARNALRLEEVQELGADLLSSIIRRELLVSPGFYIRWTLAAPEVASGQREFLANMSHEIRTPARRFR
jgi:signal transduction histidine kinase